MRIAMGYRTSMKGWDTCLTLWYLLVNVLTPRLVIINWTICKQSARGYCCAKVIVIEVRWHWVNIFCLCCTTRRAHHITSMMLFISPKWKITVLEMSLKSSIMSKLDHQMSIILIEFAGPKLQHSSRFDLLKNWVPDCSAQDRNLTKSY